MSRTSKLLVAVLLIPPWVVFGVCVYWYFFDTNPPARFSTATLFNARGEQTNEFQRGEVMLVSRERCIDDSGLVVFNGILFHKQKRVMYFLPSTQVMFRKEGCSRAYKDVTIPAYAEPGPYDYIVTVRYVNNPLVEGVITLPAPEIVVVPGDK